MATKSTTTLNAAAFIAAAATLARKAEQSRRHKVNAKGKKSKTKSIAPTIEEAKAWLFAEQSVLEAAIDAVKAARTTARESGASKALPAGISTYAGKVKMLPLKDKQMIAIASAQMKRAVNLNAISQGVKVFIPSIKQKTK